MALHPGCLKPELPLQKNQLIVGAFVGVAAGVCNGRDSRGKLLVGDVHIPKSLKRSEKRDGA